MSQKKGILSALGAYLVWGFLPLYFKVFQSVPAVEIIAHRVVWSFVFMTIVILLRKEGRTVLSWVKNGRIVAIYVITALLLGANWLLYVWGVNAGHIVETSLGYFINPLFSVALGVVVLREKLRPLQWLPVGIAAAGVLYLTIEYRALPWIAIGLAFTFGMYGLIKKVAPLGAMHGLTLETAALFLPALAYLIFLHQDGNGAFNHLGLPQSIFLLASGIITSLPLLMYATAARNIPLTLLGILQYSSPTLQLLTGIFIYGESFGKVQLIGYGMIWLALAAFTLEGWAHYRKAAPLEHTSAVEA